MIGKHGSERLVLKRSTSIGGTTLLPADGAGLQIRAWRSGVLKFSVRKDIMQKRVNARRTGEKNRKSTRGRLSKKLVNSHETELILCLCTKGFYLLLFYGK